MIIVGWLKNSGMAYPEFLKKESTFTVNDLLSDLPKLKPGLESSEYRTKTWSKCVSETEVRTSDDVLTLHKSRPNKERDIEIYKRAIELWNDGHKRLNYNDLPEKLKTHKNRHSFVGWTLFYSSRYRTASFHYCARSCPYSVIPR